MSAHFLVKARLKVVGGLRSNKRVDDVKRLLKTSVPDKSEKERAYQKGLRKII